MATELEFRVGGLLIDLDGTLVDSTAVVDTSWARVADRLGLPPEEVVGQFHGMTAAATLRLLAPELDEAGVAALASEIHAWELEDAGLSEPLPGAVALLDRLSADVWCVVTSGPRELALARLAGSGLPTPRHLVSADDVAASKPSPEPYLRGAATLGLVASTCLAIEDAPAGVESAVAAGCAVIGLATTHEDLDVATVPDLSHLSCHAEGDLLVVRRASSARPAP